MLLTRLDRNLATRSTDLNAHYRDESSRFLVKRMIGFFAFSFHYDFGQRDIFGNTSFTVETIEKVFGYSPRVLRNRHPDPAQLRHHPGEAARILERDERAGRQEAGVEPGWLSNLDNALYLLFYSPAPYTRPGKTPYGTVTSELNQALVLQSLQKYYLNKTRKAVYVYRLHESFIRNTASYFLFFDFNLFRKLTEQELDVYLTLLNAKAIETYKFEKDFSVTPSEVQHTGSTIDLLASRWNLAVPDGVNPFSHWKKRINQIIDSINKKAGYPFCEVVWRRARAMDRFEGQPVLVFPLNHPVEQALASKERTQDRLKRFLLYYLEEHYRVYCAGKPFASPQDFRKQLIHYLFNDKQDVEGKRKVLAEVYELVYRKPFDARWNETHLSMIKSYAAEMASLPVQADKELSIEEIMQKITPGAIPGHS